MSRMQFLALLAGLTVAAILTGLAVPGAAAVPPGEAASLKSTLTPTGAVRAANADGTIPAWTGGYATTATARAGAREPDVYSDEKPIFSITKENMEKYSQKLSEGTKFLLQNRAGYRLDVYQTHRSFSAPQAVYDGTYQNALQAAVTSDGRGVTGVGGGIPFPLPKTGLELVWDALLNFRGSDRQLDTASWFVNADGTRSLANANYLAETFPLYYPSGRNTSLPSWAHYVVRALSTAPAYQNGDILTAYLSDNYDIHDDETWQYLTGQRRVRKAPQAAFDTPFPYTSGITNFDDTNGFNGSPERYDWKLVGRAEYYIPYNNNHFFHIAETAKLLDTHFVNPDNLRWELHRVWVVDGTLKAGKRHTVPHRRFYIDEDSYWISLSDQWDANGALWKSLQGLMVVCPDVPTVTETSLVTYELLANSYAIFNTWNDPKYRGVSFKSDIRDDYFTPESMASQGVN